MNETDSDPVVRLVIAFNDMLNAHNVDGMMQYLSGDCIFENTYPAPDGTRYEGQAAVRGFWADFFRIEQDQTIAIEEIFALGDRCVMRWVYQWNEIDGGHHIRGVDLYKTHQGKITEKLSYVKG